MMDNYGSIFSNGIRSCNKKYPNRNMVDQIDGAIKQYIIILRTKMNYKEANNIFCKCFPRTDIDTQEVVRKNFKEYPDAVLCLLDYMYTFCFNEISKTRTESINRDYIDAILKYCNKYVDIISKHKSTNLLQVRNRLYFDPDDLIELSSELKPLLDFYINNLLKKDTTKNVEVTETGKELFKDLEFNNIENIFNYKLMDSFHGTYKSGNVTINAASTLGYKKYRRPQQDAVLTTSKDGVSLNVIADGAGGSNMGQIASLLTIQELKKWFDSYDFSKFKKISSNDHESIKKASCIISDSLNQKINEIDEMIKEKYEGSYSTLVSALVTPGFILFANVGDSTAYVFDDDEKTISEKTVLDSFSKGMSYEEARHNPNNNMITNGVGMMQKEAHFNVMPNIGSYRIILSSDGITDLINKNNFEHLLTKGYSAEEFVSKADRYPDVTKGMKSEDNISALIIESDEYSKKRRTR